MTDAHKWLNVPYDSGIVLCAHPESHRAAMTITASYLIQDESERRVRDQVDWVPEFSRRARGFAVYAALRSLGRRGLAELVERACDAASAFAAQIVELPGRRGAQRRRPQPGALPVRVRRADRRGAARRSGERPRLAERDDLGRAQAIRLSVSNWQTGDDEIALAVAAFRPAVYGQIRRGRAGPRACGREPPRATPRSRPARRGRRRSRSPRARAGRRDPRSRCCRSRAARRGSRRDRRPRRRGRCAGVERRERVRVARVARVVPVEAGRVRVRVSPRTSPGHRDADRVREDDLVGREPLGQLGDATRIDPSLERAAERNADRHRRRAVGRGEHALDRSIASASDAFPLCWLNSSVAASVTLTRSRPAAAKRS